MKSQTKILDIKNLTIGFIYGKRDNSIFKDISIHAFQGELISVIGRNGIGKSTLLKTLVRLLDPIQGDIYIDDRMIQHYNPKQFAQRVGYVSTELINIPNLKVIELVSLGRFPHTNWFGTLHSEDLKKSYEALEWVGMTHFAQKNVNEISDGERQRVMIARTLSQDTDIIILDEPTAFLDIRHKYEMIYLLKQLSKDRNKTIIFSSHDLNILLREVDKIWLMHNQKIIEGAPEDLIMQNHFKNIFDTPDLVFDNARGDFVTVRKRLKKIKLAGKGDVYNYTSRALSRLNYEITTTDETDLSVTIKGDKKPRWQLKKDGSIFEVESIYDLSLLLIN